MRSPARLTINACSSLPLCFSTCDRMETRMPTAAILNMIVTSIPRPLPPDFILLPKQNRKHCTAENSQTVIQFFLCRSSFLRLLYHPFEFTFIE